VRKNVAHNVKRSLEIADVLEFDFGETVHHPTRLTHKKCTGFLQSISQGLMDAMSEHSGFQYRIIPLHDTDTRV